MRSLDDLHDALCCRNERPTWTVIGEELALVVHNGPEGRLIARWDAEAGRVWLANQTHTAVLDGALYSFLARVVDEMDLGLTLDHSGARLAFRASIELDADGALGYARFEQIARACVRQTVRCLSLLEMSYSPTRRFAVVASS